MNWQDAKRTPPPDRFYATPSKAPKFAITYARYAASERASGRQPLPPTQWIKLLKTGGARS
jgi:hypothetical protein